MRTEESSSFAWRANRKGREKNFENDGVTIGSGVRFSPFVLKLQQAPMVHVLIK